MNTATIRKTQSENYTLKKIQENEIRGLIFADFRQYPNQKTRRIAISKKQRRYSVPMNQKFISIRTKYEKKF